VTLDQNIIPAAVLLAFAAGALSSAGIVWLRRRQMRLGGGEPAGVQDAPRAAKSRPGFGFGRVPDWPRARPGQLADGSRARPRRSQTNLKDVSPAVQTAEFIEWMRAWGFTGRQPHAAILYCYAWWAEEAEVRPMPPAALLARLARCRGVKKTRDRVKDDQTGKVIKLESGSPVRTSFYRISESTCSAGPDGTARRGKSADVGEALANPESRIAA
jgi:hypothetical protein